MSEYGASSGHCKEAKCQIMVAIERGAYKRLYRNQKGMHLPEKQKARESGRGI